jgi:hypothetical protein
MHGKYASPLGEALHRLCQEQWANESTGNVEAPTGYVWRITITEAELPEVRSALDAIWEDHPYDDEGRACAEMVGAWIVVEDTQGFVTCTNWATDEPARTFDDRARVQFRMAEQAYATWEGATE